MTTHSPEATQWLKNYHGSIDSTALLLAFDAGRALPSTGLVAGPRLLELVEQIGSHVASEYEDDPHLDSMILELRKLPIANRSDVEAGALEELVRRMKRVSAEDQELTTPIEFIEASIARLRSAKAEA